MNYFEYQQREEDAKNTLDKYDFSSELSQLCKDGKTQVDDIVDGLNKRHSELADVFDLLSIQTIAEYFKERYSGFHIKEITSFHVMKHEDSCIEKAAQYR